MKNPLLVPRNRVLLIPFIGGPMMIIGQLLSIESIIAVAPLVAGMAWALAFTKYHKISEKQSEANKQ